MFELLGGFVTRAGIKQTGDGVKYLYRTVDCHTEHEKFFSGNEEDKATVLREVSEQERPLQVWTVDSAQPQQQYWEQQENIDEEAPTESSHSSVRCLSSTLPAASCMWSDMCFLHSLFSAV